MGSFFWKTEHPKYCCWYSKIRSVTITNHVELGDQRQGNGAEGRGTAFLPCSIVDTKGQAFWIKILDKHKRTFSSF